MGWVIVLGGSEYEEGVLKGRVNETVRREC